MKTSMPLTPTDVDLLRLRLVHRAQLREAVRLLDCTGMPVCLVNGSQKRP